MCSPFFKVLLLQLFFKMKGRVIKFIVLWNWDSIINGGGTTVNATALEVDWRTWQGQKLRERFPGPALMLLIMPKLPYFPWAVFILKELPVNKGNASICWFLLLNNVSGAKGSEISHMHPVKCWNHAINYFEYIGDFPSDLLQRGMCADGLLLHIYCHG